MSTLTTAQILGLTGEEPPLTDADRRAAVDYFLGGCWYGEWLLAGGERADHIRHSHLGTFGRLDDGTDVSCIADGPGGFLAVVGDRPDVRAGHITWRDAAAILRAAQPDEGALFNLEAS